MIVSYTKGIKSEKRNLISINFCGIFFSSILIMSIRITESEFNELCLANSFEAGKMYELHVENATVNIRLLPVSFGHQIPDDDLAFSKMVAETSYTVGEFRTKGLFSMFFEQDYCDFDWKATAELEENAELQKLRKKKESIYLKYKKCYMGKQSNYEEELKGIEDEMSACDVAIIQLENARHEKRDVLPVLNVGDLYKLTDEQLKICETKFQEKKKESADGRKLVYMLFALNLPEEIKDCNNVGDLVQVVYKKEHYCGEGDGTSVLSHLKAIIDSMLYYFILI